MDEYLGDSGALQNNVLLMHVLKQILVDACALKIISW